MGLGFGGCKRLATVHLHTGAQDLPASLLQQVPVAPHLEVNVQDAQG